MKRLSLPVTWNLPVAGPNKFQKLIYLFCDLIQILNFWFLVFSLAVNEVWYKPEAWVMIELMALRLFFFVKYVVFSRTCVLSGTALVPFLTTSERCEGWKAWGLSTTVTITCMFVSQWNAPEKWSAYAYFLLPDGPWQIRRSEIEIMLNHMVCFPPNHVYSPALHMLFFLPVIKAVLYPNDCRGVHAWKCIFN